ncbi:hypothetical protein [Salinispora sp. H7-4]|uniref:DUF7683 domain-containing protein n=1 Tax=Salinispora sp. H7-4 TaxID=2748321 RepID=UPI0015D112FA|nr:hypothetical protein [Salinispora sp. H7-4]NYT95571.1 hypothetical protein [Salinispora sp. H7-4]
MSWVVLAYEKFGDAFESEVQLPDSFDEDVVKSLVGDYPNLRGDSFPVIGESLDRLQREYSIEIDSERFDYFIEFRM